MATNKQNRKQGPGTDNLAEPKIDSDIELTEAELARVSGGTIDANSQTPNDKVQISHIDLQR